VLTISNTVLVRGRARADLAPVSPRVPSDFLDVSATGLSGAPGVSLTVAPAPERDGVIPVRGIVKASKDSVLLAPIMDRPQESVVVVKLVLLSLDDLYVRTIDLVAPVEVQGDTVEGAFAFDLAKRPEARAVAGEVPVYLVSGRTVVSAGVLTVGPKR
jgi:hypothetical protein